MEEINPIIKLLVDSLISSVNDLSQKISNYKPILDRIGTQSDAEILSITKIISNCEQLTKLLETTAGDFYKRTDVFTSEFKDLKTKIEDLSSELNELKKSIDDVSSKIDAVESNLKKSIGIISVKIDTTQTEIKPVSKIISYLSKPFGFLTFIIGLIIASITINNGWQAFLEWLAKPKESIQQNVQKAN